MQADQPTYVHFTVSAVASLSSGAYFPTGSAPRKADEIRIDTDRILSLAKSAQEWDAMTEQPNQENVQLPYDLENNP